MMKQDNGQEGHGKESGAMAMADQQSGPGGEVKDKAAKAKAASIGITEAIAAANTHVPGTVLEAEFESEENQVFWEVEIATEDGKLMEVNVDGQTGAILSSEEKKPKDGKNPMGHGKGRMHQESKAECGHMGEGYMSDGGMKGGHMGGEGMEGGHMGEGHMGGGGMKGGHMGGEGMNGQKQE